MSNFVVSARKYRPQRFEDVVGQQHVAGTLRNALATDHLAHAFLFTGPRGVGKTTCARILARVLNCENRTPTHDACNTCSSCKAFNENASFNIIELDAASNNSVEHIRALIEQVRFQPQQGRYKVFIIDEVHMLSNQAFNAFLKTLEEPPPYAVFILATTEKHKIIPTILSRCQIFDFRRISVADMALHLQHICTQEGIEAEEDALHIIGQKADGALRDALSIFDRITSSTGKRIRYTDVIEQLNVLDYDYHFQVTEALMAEDLPVVFNLFDQILRKGFEPDMFVNGLAEHMRNLLVCQDERTLALLEVGEGLRDRYRRQAALATESFLLTGLRLANDCDINYKMARNKRLHVELMLIKLCHVNRAVAAQQTPIPEKKTPDGSLNPSNGHISSPKPVPAPANAQLLGQEEVAALKQNIKQGLQKVERIPLRLDAFEAAVAMDEAHKAGLESRLTLENARTAWLAYAAPLESPSLRQAFQVAELHLTDKTITAKVGLSLYRNALQQELGKLLDALRHQLHDPKLQIFLELDEAKILQEQPKPTRPLNAQEKIELMRQANPLVHDLIDRLGLKVIE
jgi:DNA polymerase-3 subunit gamma/tau